MGIFKQKSRNQFAPRSISLQKDQKLGKKLWLWVGGVLVGVLAIGFGWQYAHAEYFSIKSVEIIEQVGVQPSVVPVDQLEKLSKQLHDTSLLMMDVERVREDWQSRFPSIERLIIAKHYPDSVEVRYIPRVAYSQLVSPNGTYLVDRGGFIFAEGEFDKIPTLSTDEEISEIGQETSSRGLRLGLKLVEGLRTTDPALSTIVLHGSQLEIKLLNNLVVYVDDERSADMTISEIHALLQRFREEEKFPREIDMRYQQPVLRY